MSKDIAIEVTAGKASKTTTGVDGGIDVTFTLTLDGEAMTGECTLLPHEDGRIGFGSWGAPDNWIDGRTLGRLRDLFDDYRDVLGMIESVCAPVAHDFDPGEDPEAIEHDADLVDDEEEAA